MPSPLVQLLYPPVSTASGTGAGPKSTSDSDSHRDVVYTPEDTPSGTPRRTADQKDGETGRGGMRAMEPKEDVDVNAEDSKKQEVKSASPAKTKSKGKKAPGQKDAKLKAKSKGKNRKAKADKKKTKKKTVSADSDSDSDSDSDLSLSGTNQTSENESDMSNSPGDSDTSDSDTESESETERKKKSKRRSKARKDNRARKSKEKSGNVTRSKNPRGRTVPRHMSSSEDDSSSSGSQSDESDANLPPPKIKIKSQKREPSNRSDNPAGDVNRLESCLGQIHETLVAMRSDQQASSQVSCDKTSRHHGDPKKMVGDGRRGSPGNSERDRSPSKLKKKGTKLEYKRVDEVWDRKIHNFRLMDTAEDEESSEYDQYIFTVKRKFGWEGKHSVTVVDIKSRLLKDVLKEILGGIKGVSLVEETPSMDPNMLFLYLEEIRTAMKSMKKEFKSAKKRRARKNGKRIFQHLRLLVKYLDDEYAETKKTLYPLLESNLITFDLLWALFKPSTIAYTTTYGNVKEPRAFKVESSGVESSVNRGVWYAVEGRYLDFDGKSFGLAALESEIPGFKGARKITSLPTYPLKYHKERESLTKQLIERGRKFVTLGGMNYRHHNGMAFFKKKRNVIKVNVNGRVMVDPAIHRRINPNYVVNPIRAEDSEDENSETDSDAEYGGGGDSDDEGEDRDELSVKPKDNRKLKLRVIFDKDGKLHFERGDEKKKDEVKDENEIVEVSESDNEVPGRAMKKLDDDEVPAEEEGGEKSEQKKARKFTNEELLLASPLVLGFAFSEKLWLEFTVSGMNDIIWNEEAFASLVLPANQKSIVKALVESHTFHAAKTIDDVIQGKGRGLVAVLHGPPGTGKTLTAEGIAELLRRPLYMVSAGELGTDPRMLEAELNKILDITHSWGAVLLLDEADVFLEQRTIQDIHRNALVSIFLRLLEYFQGILFLTTNRVETFDDAFQSRIHVALRYGELKTKAKVSVWKMFIRRVRAMEGVQTVDFSEENYQALARNSLNGRQIKNCIRTAQALAVNNGEKLSMEHIKRVLDVAESFDRDLRGGTGYTEAMRSYT